MIPPPTFRQRFVSTKNRAEQVGLAEAVLSGPAPDGGLWVPRELHPFSDGELEELSELPFAELATAVGHRLLGNQIDQDTLDQITHDAFDFEVPLRPVGESGLSVLELFHGPTLAFKDVGARFMARLLSWAKTQSISEAATPTAETTILVATSGDTGSAVADAFLNVEGFRVVVLFPKGQVSEAQQRLFTTLGGNTHSIAVDGSFDDCQALVKRAFADQELRREMALGSANSINVARLLPQSFYYFWLYNQLDQDQRRRPLRICVPSGNFGNLSAGLIAQRLGLKVDGFVAATNANDIVPDFLDGADYQPRASISTVANAMDVGAPSNFERVLWLFGGSESQVRAAVRGKRYSNDEIHSAIREVLEHHGMLLDPHAAIGFLGARDDHRDWAASKATERNRIANSAKPVCCFLATAHPAKFASAVEAATGSTIPLPSALQEALTRTEVVVDLPADYEPFKELLRAL